MITLRDIAQEAGVSAVTVSNVINGKHSRVSKSTIEKVNKLIEKYNYIPNASARSLVRKSSKIIGVIIPDVSDNSNILTSPYNAQIVGVLERLIRQKGYYLMFRCASNNDEIRTTLQMWNVDGAIISGISNELIDYLDTTVNIPIVYLDSYYNNEHIMNVGSDDYKGGYLATKHLIEQGHRNIGFAAPQIEVDEGVIRERYHGYLDALNDYKIVFEKDYIFTNCKSYEDGCSLGEVIAHITPSLTGLVVTADIIGIGVIEGARSAGLSVPDDLSIIGYDNLPICNYCHPKLTTIAQDINEKAELAANLLIRSIEKGKRNPVNQTSDVTLITRESVTHPKI